VAIYWKLLFYGNFYLIITR